MSQVKQKPKNLKESNSWFMRFYGRTDDEIRQCLTEIGVKQPYTITDAQVTANFPILGKDDQPVRQVDIYFPTHKECLEFGNNDRTKTIYHKWATKHPEKAELVIRKPGELAFGL